MICCDSCPYSPTCEEEDEFLASIGLVPEGWDEISVAERRGWGEDVDS